MGSTALNNNNNNNNNPQQQQQQSSSSSSSTTTTTMTTSKILQVSLNVHRGNCIGVTGPSGSGKTQLLKSLIGLATTRQYRYSNCSMILITIILINRRVGKNYHGLN